jgi:hypothetical protein
MPLDRTGGSRAPRLGSHPVRLAVVGAVVVAAVAALAGGITLGGSDGTAGGYGQIPSWIPKATVPVGRIVEASASRPRLAIQGDSVSVRLARGRVLATAVGPAVPPLTLPPPPTTRCTFTVTLAAASGVVPLSAGAFTIVDELGRLHRPLVTRQGGGPLPQRVAPGETVTLTIRDVLPTGSGRLRWTPEGTLPIVSWDFDVEVD